MLLRFFETLREFRVPVSTRELLDLLAAMQHRFAFADRDAFYQLARLCLVKDERFFDRFDRAFKYFFDTVGGMDGLFDAALPPAALADLLAPFVDAAFVQAGTAGRAAAQAELRELIAQYQQQVAQLHAQTAAADANGGERDDDDAAAPSDKNADGHGSAEKGEREKGEKGEEGEGEDGQHGEDGNGEEGESGESDEGGESGEEGDSGEDGEGSRGDSDIGADGEHEEGTRKGQERGQRRVATRIWEERLFADLDDDVELGTRTFKIALRRLRKFARVGAEDEFDLPGTIDGTARNGGVLDVRMIPERRNNVKVLLLLDIGGSMDEHVQVCEQLFSAASSEFKYLVELYFHNFTYDYVWTDAARREEHRVAMFDVIRKYGRDYKVVFVGDANMGLHEILERGGCIERYNEESGVAWFARLHEHFRRVAWINPTPVTQWSSAFSIVRIQRMLDGHMYPLTNEGLTGAMRWLAK